MARKFGQGVSSLGHDTAFPHSWSENKRKRSAPIWVKEYVVLIDYVQMISEGLRAKQECYERTLILWYNYSHFERALSQRQLSESRKLGFNLQKGFPRLGWSSCPSTCIGHWGR